MTVDKIRNPYDPDSFVQSKEKKGRRITEGLNLPDDKEFDAQMELSLTGTINKFEER